jgi:hypothetical protein
MNAQPEIGAWMTVVAFATQFLGGMLLLDAKQRRRFNDSPASHP